MNAKCIAVAFFLLGGTQVFGAAITGKITAVADKEATIVLDQTAQPGLGDPVTVYFLLPGAGEEVLVGNGKITAVTGDSVRATIDDLKGTLEKNQLVRIELSKADSKSASTPATSATAAPIVDLTGTWSCDDKGTYEIKQSGNRVTWEGKSQDSGKTWSHTFEGAIAGDIITGTFRDHPPGRFRGKGSLTVRIAGPNGLEKINSSTPFGGARWEKITASPSIAPVVTYRGKYTAGFEMSEFVPCDRDERWWLTGDLGAARALLKPAPKGTRQTIFMEVTGRLTPRGRYGHLGRYHRQLTVESVAVARALRKGDCF